MNENKKSDDKEISTVTAVLMIFVAIIFDTIQAVINLIPFLGQTLSFLISIFSFLTFYVWFKVNGVSFSKPKRILKFAGGFFVELIPIINILPALTLSVFLIIGETKIKEAVVKIPGSKVANTAINRKIPKK